MNTISTTGLVIEHLEVARGHAWEHDRALDVISWAFHQHRRWCRDCRDEVECEIGDQYARAERLAWALQK